MLEEVWLAGETADAASALRLAALRTIGVVTGDDAVQDAGSVARFLCAAAGSEAEAEAVQAALAAAAAAGGDEQPGEPTEAPDQVSSGAVEAGKACLAALRA
eukprot:6191321-Pleurochrysis_carterae.AAC.1